MARIRIKLHLSKRQRIFLEIGIAILCIILFLGALNTIAMTYSTPIVTVEDLYKHAVVRFEFRNATAPSRDAKWISMPLRDIATIYNGYIYMSIPYPSGFEVLRTIIIENITTSDGEPLTVKYMLDHGVNHVLIYVEPINTTDIVFSGTFYVSPLTFRFDSGNGYIDCGDKVIANIGYSASVNAKDIEKFNALFPDNGTLDRSANIDLGTLVVMSLGRQNARVGFHWFLGDIHNLKGLKMKIEIDAVSTKPVLKALTDPIYSVVTGLWSALLAFWRRVKSIVASAAGGFGISALFTGLLGDPVTAMILSIVIVTVLFLVMRKGR